MSNKNLLALGAVGLIALALYIGWNWSQSTSLPPGFAKSNGRIEAVEIDVAAKIPGRLVELHVHEGDFVTAGQALAKMDTEVLEAQRKQAEAELLRAKSAVETAKSSVLQRESEKAAAEAIVAQRDVELELAKRILARAEGLLKTNAVSVEEYETNRAAQFGALAAVSSAKANVAGATAAINTAKSHVIQAEANVEAAQASIDRFVADIKDCTLRSPRDGRIQYRIAQLGEVLSAGGKVLNLVDLADVYMTFFLPTAEAGRVQIGADARLVLDAAPHLVIPAKISFVADVAQFTPKTVETVEERQKLMFRIKAQIDPELLKKHIRSVKTGLPGMAYVQLDPQAPWPAELQTSLPQE